MLLAAPLTVMFLAAASLLVEAELGDRVRQAAQGTQVGKDEADAAAMADRADMATAAATAVKAINYLLFRPAVCRVERGGETMEEVSIPAGRILAAVPLLFCLALIKPVLAVWRGRVRAGAALCVGGWLRHGSGRCGVGSSTSVYGQYYIFSRSLHSFLFPPTIPSLY